MSDKPEIVVIGRFVIAPETLDAVRDALVTMQEASRAEDGCLDYTFSTDLGDSTSIRLSERWANRDALLAHFKMPHMADFRTVLAANPPSSAEVHFFEATEVDRPEA